MAVKCHTQATGAAPAGAGSGRSSGTRVPDDALLDAARECVLDVGVRRSTLTRIARTAGVSRMTLYRRFPDVDSALAALMTREFSALLSGVRAATETGANARERLVTGTVAAVRALDADPLMRSVLDHDAEAVLPYIVRRLGATQRHAEAFITEMIDNGRADGSIRVMRRRAQIRTVLLVAQSFTLSMRPASADVEPEALLSELEHTLNAALRPAQEGYRT